MVDASREVDLGRLEGVVGGEVDGKEEDTTRVRRLALCQSVCVLVEDLERRGPSTWRSRTSRQQFILVPGRDAGGGLAGRQSGWGSAYRSHDGCLPVKLSQGQPSRTTRRRRDLDGRDTRLGDPVRGCRSVARSSPGVDIPDPRQRVQRSKTTAGH